MSERGFEFSAQYALDRALVQREQRERELARALRALESQEQAQSALRLAHQTALDAVASARRELARPLPGERLAEELEAGRAQLRALRRREGRQSAIVVAGQQAVTIAAGAVRDARAAFDRAHAAATMLAQIRDVRLREFKTLRLQADQRDQDDAALAAWRRGQTAR